MIKVKPSADLAAAARWAHRGGPKIESELRAALRGSAQPIVSLAQRRFRALPGTGARVADTVKATASPSRLTVRMGGRGTPYAAGREFGTRKTQDRLGRPIDYTRPAIFGAWTGNKFTLAGTGKISGRAFHPSIRDGMRDVDTQLTAAIDQIMSR